MNKIVVVGGGTAGWVSAISIACRFPDKRIVVVDPKVIGPIGVGESVTGVVTAFITDPLHRLNIGEFFRRCDVTFKAGIWYKDWHGVGTDYLSPIDIPSEYFEHRYPACSEEFYAAMTVERARLGDVQLYSNLMRTNRTDHFKDAVGRVNEKAAKVSVHFDALKFAAWLQEISPRYPNIEHIDDVVESFAQDPDSGFVTQIRTKSGREVPGDFFIDCTGFHRLLLAKAYAPKWISYADKIKVDSAIPCFLPYAPNEEPTNYTLAAAMPNGWMFRIPTQTRYGYGHLFSSRYTDVKEAVAHMRAVGVDPGDNPRVLRFEPGRTEKQWMGNVCAIGLSAGFIEPLEATTIHGIYVQLRLLTELFLPYCTRESMPVLSEQYSRLVSMAYDDYLDFISMHYHAGRTDTEFWRDCQKPEALTATNRERLEKWRFAFPMREDFSGIVTQRTGHLTGLPLWAPMICGLEFFRQEPALCVLRMSQHPLECQQNITRYLQVRNRITSSALTHVEAIEYMRAKT
jgi:tryptophan halogenase